MMRDVREKFITWQGSLYRGTDEAVTLVRHVRAQRFVSKQNEVKDAAGGIKMNKFRKFNGKCWFDWDG